VRRSADYRRGLPPQPEPRGEAGLSSVYEALQRARQGGQVRGPVSGAAAPSGAIPLRPQQSQLRSEPQPQPQRARPERPPPVSLAPSPKAVALGPLLAAVRPLLDGEEGIVLQFAAATAGEGTSTIAREFALLAATAGHRRILLIDADRRSLGSARAFDCDIGLGLVDCLWNGAEERDVVRRVPGTQLSVACLIGERGPAACDAETVREIYAGVREHFELTIVDCPAVGGGGFTELLPEAADGVVMVVEAERTRPAVILHAKTLVEQAGGTIIGAVLNKRNNYIPEMLYRLL